MFGKHRFAIVIFLAVCSFGRAQVVAGYPDRLSYVAGDRIAFHMATPGPTFDVEIARIGPEREVVFTRGGIPGVARDWPADASSHGCRWPKTFEVAVPSTWRSGYYEMVTWRVDAAGTRTAGDTLFFVVRAAHPGRDADILMHLTTNTQNAYNNQGGYSLYAFNGREGVQGRRVSFHRPQIHTFQHTWEVPFIRWAETAGYRIDYAVNHDLERFPELLTHYRMLVSVGHDEYWSAPMRDAVEGFIDDGGNVAFLTGNTCCWQVRFEDDGTAMTCWKQTEEKDPLFESGPHALLSSLWSHHLVDRPENEMVGVGFLWGGYHRSHGQFMQGSGAYRVHRPEHWVFRGTGLTAGDAFGGAHTIVGYECDGCQFTIVDGKPVPTFVDGTPKTFQILATAPARWHPADCEWYERWEKGRTGNACMGIYTEPGGGTVFAAATTDWSHGLQGGDPQVTRITTNVLDRLSGLTEPRSAEASLRAMRVRDGFVVDLVAAEPLVMDPVAFDWGPDGALWVVEMADYPTGMDGNGAAGGRIVTLRDTDGDGRYDARTVFFDGIGFPTGVMVWRDGVLVTAAPDIFFVRDTTGDGMADERRTLFTGFGEGNTQHRVNCMRWGLDNWVYVANGDSGGMIGSTTTPDRASIRGRDLRILPDEGRLEAVEGQTQFGRNRNDWGDWFGCWNEHPAWHFALPERYTRRNPHYAPPAGRIQVSPNREVFPLGRVISHWEEYRPPAPGEPHKFTSSCSVMIYRDDLLGDDVAGDLFVSEPIHNLVHRMQLAHDGVGYKGTRAPGEEHSEFLASRDPWFRPATVRTGPDGALWIADMYRWVLEHPDWMDDEFEKVIDLRAGHDKGRIYRVYREGTEPRALPKLDPNDPASLARRLDHPNGWVRDLAQRLLVQRGARDTAGELIELLRADRPQARLHALCTLDAMNRLTDEHLLVALRDPHPGVRRNAVRVAEPRLNASARLGDALLELGRTDRDPKVRKQLAFSLGEWVDREAGMALGPMLTGDDPLLAAAAMTSAAPHAEVLIRQVGLGALAVRNPDTRDRVLELHRDLIVLTAFSNDAELLSRVLTELVRPNQPPQSLAGFFDELGRRGELFGELLAAAENPSALRRQIDLAFAAARTIANDGDRLVTDRVAALDLLGRWLQQRDNDLRTLESLLDSKNPIELQLATVQALVRIGDRETPARLLASWKQHVPRVRAALFDAFTSRVAWTNQLLDTLEGDSQLAASIGTAQRQVLETHPVESTRARARVLFASATSADRAAVITRYAKAAELPGDVARGAVVFQNACATCHRLGGIGKALGPDLASISDRPKRSLITAILDPNRDLVEDYVQYFATTTTWRTFAGIVAEETGTSITLVGLDGVRHKILRRDLRALESTNVSWMPVGLEGMFDEQGLADLLAFVRDAGSPPKAFEGNTPRVIGQEDDGTLQLTSRTCEIRGPSLRFENTFGDLGYWGSPNDRATWTVRVKEGGKFGVYVNWACHPGTAGNTFLFRIGEAEVSAPVPSTGAWESYKLRKFGTIDVPVGEHRAVFRSAGAIREFLIDLRAVELRPESR